MPTNSHHYINMDPCYIRGTLGEKFRQIRTYYSTSSTSKKRQLYFYYQILRVSDSRPHGHIPV